MFQSSGFFKKASLNAAALVLVLVLATTVTEIAKSAPVQRSSIATPSQNVIQNQEFPSQCVGPKCPPSFTQSLHPTPQITCIGSKCPPSTASHQIPSKNVVVISKIEHPVATQKKTNSGDRHFQHEKRMSVEDVSDPSNLILLGPSVNSDQTVAIRDPNGALVPVIDASSATLKVDQTVTIRNSNQALVPSTFFSSANQTVAIKNSKQTVVLISSKTKTNQTAVIKDVEQALASLQQNSTSNQSVAIILSTLNLIGEPFQNTSSIVYPPLSVTVPSSSPNKSQEYSPTSSVNQSTSSINQISIKPTASVRLSKNSEVQNDQRESLTTAVKSPSSKNLVDQNTLKTSKFNQSLSEITSTNLNQLTTDTASCSNTTTSNDFHSHSQPTTHSQTQTQTHIPAYSISNESHISLTPRPSFIPNHIPIQRPNVQIPRPNLSSTSVSKEFPIHRQIEQLPRISKSPSTKSSASSGSNLKHNLVYNGRRRKPHCIPGTKKSDPRNHRQNDEDFVKAVEIDRSEQMIARKPVSVLRNYRSL